MRSRARARGRAGAPPPPAQCGRSCGTRERRPRAAARPRARASAAAARPGGAPRRRSVPPCRAVASVSSRSMRLSSSRSRAPSRSETSCSAWRRWAATSSRSDVAASIASLAARWASSRKRSTVALCSRVSSAISSISWRTPRCDLLELLALPLLDARDRAGEVVLESLEILRPLGQPLLDPLLHLVEPDRVLGRRPALLLLELLAALLGQPAGLLREDACRARSGRRRASAAAPRCAPGTPARSAPRAWRAPLRTSCSRPGPFAPHRVHR